MTPRQNAAHQRGQAILLAEVGHTAPLERQLAQDYLRSPGVVPYTKTERQQIHDRGIAYLQEQAAWLACWNARGSNARLPAIEARRHRALQHLRECISQVRAQRAARAIRLARKHLETRHRLGTVWALQA